MLSIDDSYFQISAFFSRNLFLCYKNARLLVKLFTSVSTDIFECKNQQQFDIFKWVKRCLRACTGHMKISVLSVRLYEKPFERPKSLPNSQKAILMSETRIKPFKFSKNHSKLRKKILESRRMFYSKVRVRQMVSSIRNNCPNVRKIFRRALIYQTDNKIFAH